MKYILLCLTIIIICSGCRSTSHRRLKRSQASASANEFVPRMTVEQIQFVIRYDRLRHRVLRLLRLPDEITFDAFRPHAAAFLELPKTSSWQDIIAELERRKYLTENRRERVTFLLDLPPDMTWMEIKDVLEKLRLYVK